jgi:hypothetical protein
MRRATFRSISVSFSLKLMACDILILLASVTTRALPYQLFALGAYQ